MKKHLFIAIIWTLLSGWWIYRNFTDFSVLQTQALWLTIGDAICALCYISLAVTYWVIYAKGRKAENKEEK